MRRVVAERVGEALKQPLVVENVTGAAGMIGAERVAKARPDGYVLAALNNSILTILPSIQRERVKFDSFEDFYLPSGKVRPIAFAGGRRSPAFPELPTVARWQPPYWIGGRSPLHRGARQFHNQPEAASGRGR